MGNEPNYRRFSTELPLIRCYNTAGTDLVRTIALSELDNPLASYEWNWQMEEDASPFKTQAKTVHEFPLGCRLTMAATFPVYAEELSALPPSQQAEGFAFTERDYWFLLEWRRVGGNILFYPHKEWATQYGYDKRFIVRLAGLSKTHADAKTSYFMASMALEGRYITDSTYAMRLPDEM